MISAKAGLESIYRATAQTIGGRTVVNAFPTLKREWEEKEEDYPEQMPAFQSGSLKVNPIVLGESKKVLNLKGQLFNNRSVISSGIGASHQYRLAHTDLKMPDFTPYRRESTKDPKKSAQDTIDNRRAFNYVVISGAGIGGAIFAKNAVINVIQMMTPAKDKLSLGKVEVNIGNIPEGKSITAKWRGKPIFIRHRTQKEIDQERGQDIAQLRDPEDDAKRAPNPQWLIVIGVCTHLGCVPIAGKGDFGGYYCPCHGSHYDASGRIRKGPAPLNLEVPPYEIQGDNLIVG